MAAGWCDYALRSARPSSPDRGRTGPSQYSGSKAGHVPPYIRGPRCIGMRRTMRNASTRRLPTCGPSILRGCSPVAPHRRRAGATPRQESGNQRYEGCHSIRALRVCRSVVNRLKLSERSVSRERRPVPPGRRRFLFHRADARARARTLIDFTSALGGTADMAGPAADLLPVENDPESRTCRRASKGSRDKSSFADNASGHQFCLGATVFDEVLNNRAQGAILQRDDREGKRPNRQIDSQFD